MRNRCLKLFHSLLYCANDGHGKDSAASEVSVTSIGELELAELKLENDMIYYASDVPTRASMDQAVTNKCNRFVKGYNVNHYELII